jgi:hypothetical protein
MRLAVKETACRVSTRAVYRVGAAADECGMWPPRDAVYHAASTLKRRVARNKRATRVSSADASGSLATCPGRSRLLEVVTTSAVGGDSSG